MTELVQHLNKSEGSFATNEEKGRKEKSEGKDRKQGQAKETLHSHRYIPPPAKKTKKDTDVILNDNAWVHIIVDAKTRILECAGKTTQHT